jgi:ubiquitin carboxyl-terminal hydrolase 12/46
VNETKCTCCETVTTREEKFIDLSLDVQGDCSLRDCLAAFNAREMIDKGDKYYCETCCLRQEAFRCMRIKQLPSVLVCHLKRFKFMENLQRFVKLSHEVRFPEVLAFPASHYHPARSYSLFAVVVHIGSGMRQGHYVAMVKAHDTWFMFDDEDVSVIPFEVVQRCFGAVDAKQHYDGYLLFYH